MQVLPESGQWPVNSWFRIVVFFLCTSEPSSLIFRRGVCGGGGHCVERHTAVFTAWTGSGDICGREVPMAAKLSALSFMTSPQ